MAQPSPEKAISITLLDGENFIVRRMWSPQ